MSNDESNTTEVPKTDPEAAGQGSNTGSNVQGQEPAPVLTLISFQTTPEVIGQTEVRPEAEVQAEEEGNQGEAVHSSGSEAQASGDSSKSPLISLATKDSPSTVSDSAEAPSTPNKISTPSLGLPEQDLNASAVQPKNDSQVAQVVKQSPNIVVDDSGSEAANLAKNPPVPVESQPGSAPPNTDSAARRAFHAYLGTVASTSKVEPSNLDSDKHEAVSQDQLVTTRGNWPAQSFIDDQNTGVKTQWTLPHGQQLSSAWTEHFSEFWNDHQSRQHGQTEVKLPQAAVADLQVSNSQSTESIMAGAHGRVVSSPQPPPSTVTFVSQTQSAVPAHNIAETSAHVMARSVVFNLAQPDLGHVNIRVAMMNDVVHTHLLADRPEVGQFLINGQDRLQAAFQANGLDMGQFRVDIDRQSAGRSFQQGQFQEQGQAWNQGSHGMEHEHGHRDWQDEPHVSLHGLLNVVA